MFCDLINALAFVYGVNNDSDEDLKRDRHIPKPIEPWYTQDGKSLKAEMTAKWLVNHQETFKEVYQQLLAAGKQDDSMERIQAILEQNCPVFTDEMLIFGLCMQFNAAGESVEEKTKTMVFLDSTVKFVNYFRKSGITPVARKQHKITLLRKASSYTWHPEYFDGCYFWTIHEHEGTFYAWSDSNDQMAHDGDDSYCGSDCDGSEGDDLPAS
jgi:hypothetical protein